MYIDTWTSGYKVTASPWYKDNLIYFNVQWFSPGSSMNKPRIDKTVYVVDNERGRQILTNWLDSFTNYVAGINVPKNKMVVINAEV